MLELFHVGLTVIWAQRLDPARCTRMDAGDSQPDIVQGLPRPHCRSRAHRRNLQLLLSLSEDAPKSAKPAISIEHNYRTAARY